MMERAKRRENDNKNGPSRNQRARTATIRRQSRGKGGLGVVGNIKGRDMERIRATMATKGEGDKEKVGMREKAETIQIRRQPEDPRDNVTADRKRPSNDPNQ